MSDVMEIIEEKATVLEATLEAELKDLEASMTFSLADAIREGSSVTGQAVCAWSDNDGNVCALSAALVSLKARHLL